MILRILNLANQENRDHSVPAPSDGPPQVAWRALEILVVFNTASKREGTCPMKGKLSLAWNDCLTITTILMIYEKTFYTPCVSWITCQMSSYRCQKISKYFVTEDLSVHFFYFAKKKVFEHNVFC